MPKRIDRTGQRFGRITIIARAAQPEGRKYRGAYWLCRCDCGVEKVMNNSNIIGNYKKYGDLSCGCIKAEKLRQHFTTHGMTNTERYDMWGRCKERAKAKGIAFTIAPEDIPPIPSVCPYLGIPLFKAGNKKTANSPSVDRIDTSLGYIPGNIQIISNKANIMKSNASFEEVERLYFGLKAQREAAGL